MWIGVLVAEQYACAADEGATGHPVRRYVLGRGRPIGALSATRSSRLVETQEEEERLFVVEQIEQIGKELELFVWMRLGPLTPWSMVMIEGRWSGHEREQKRGGDAGERVCNLNVRERAMSR